LDVGLFSAPVGAHTEYHFLPEAAPRGGWTVACFRPDGSQRAWQVQQDGNWRVMAQTFDKPQRNFHPLLVAGDPLWTAYLLTVRFEPRGEGVTNGVVFRYHNNRCYYFFGLQAGRAVLKRVRDEQETVLAERKCPWRAGREYVAAVTVEGRRIRAEIEGVCVLEAEDEVYAAGRVGLLADGPTRFRHVKVTTSSEEKQRLDARLAKQQRDLEELRAANPRPVLWKKIKTEGFGAGRNLRFGDLDGDGQIDVVIGQVVHHGPGDQYSELSCLTAMTFDGKILKHHRIGHVQNPAIADFRPDLPGLEVVSINFWGNQGILHFYDAQGNIYHDCEPNPFGSMCLPVNWMGRPGEYFVHNPNVRWGGMFDGWGRCVVTFPDDGHPDMCNAVLDITGDCRDEVVVWDPKQIWVYTQSDNPKPGRLYRPRRNPLYNYSNYQATVSLPGWSE
jgi:hypothetical protein